jgi:uncharacterized protein YegP (UPF0339 family)
MRFEIFKDASGEYRWRLRAANQQIIGTAGEGYTRREDAHRAVTAIQVSIAVASIVDIAE